MTVKRIQAASGAELTIINTGKFKTNYFALNFYVPLERESAAEIALLSRVLTRGTQKYPSIGALNRHTDMLYDLSFSLNSTAVGNYQVLGFRMDHLGSRFVPSFEDINMTEEAFGFVREFFGAPLVKDGAFSAEYTESEKKLLLDRIRGEINNKSRYAIKRGRRHMLGSHPAAVSPDGDEETVSVVTPERLYSRFCDVLSSAHVEAVYMGDVGADTESLVLDTLKAILPADRVGAPLPELTPFVPETAEVRKVTEEAEAKQGRLVMGYSLPYTGLESACASVFIELFGSSPVSRLFKNVRERLSLCYYCTGNVELSLGVMWIKSGISEENLKLGTDEIAAQLKDVSYGNISEDELETAKRSILSALRSATDAPSAFVEWYLGRLINRADTDIERHMSAVECVNVADVAEFAGRAKLSSVYYLRGVDGNGDAE